MDQKSARLVVLALAASLLLVGCGGGDQLYVRSTSSEVWLIRAPFYGEGYEDKFSVTRIDPGADGIAAIVPKGLPDSAIELLTIDCELVGTFARSDGKLIVPGVDGLEAQILAAGTSLRHNTPEIITTNLCGGYHL